jgi:hypothetical protein
MLNAAGAAGISQPWRAQRHCSWRTHAFAGIRARQGERLAPVSRGTGKECAVRNVSSAQKRVTVANANSTHGGLTPAALANVRFCIAKDVVLPADERRSMRQERGGVSPPCNTFRMRTRNGQTHLIAFADAVCNPRRADVRGADESARNCNRVTHTHGGLTPAALANVRFCIADGSLCSKYTPCNQERLA